jgi:hypothetical protein
MPPSDFGPDTASPSLPPPNLVAVPSTHLPIEVLRQPLESGQYTSIAFTTRLLDAGVDTSVGSVGDAYDNALAETTVGLHKPSRSTGADHGATSTTSSAYGYGVWEIGRYLGRSPSTAGDRRLRLRVCPARREHAHQPGGRLPDHPGSHYRPPFAALASGSRLNPMDETTRRHGSAWPGLSATSSAPDTYRAAARHGRAHRYRESKFSRMADGQIRASTEHGLDVFRSPINHEGLIRARDHD